MIGKTISHYRVLSKVGEGGMGVVYKAEDTSLDRPVALKFLAPHIVSDEEISKRFEREAKAAAALNHPNVCHVYEINEVEGKTFIAMAFLEGEPLEKRSRPASSSSRMCSISPSRRHEGSRRRTRKRSFTATSSRPT